MNGVDRASEMSRDIFNLEDNASHQQQLYCCCCC